MANRTLSTSVDDVTAAYVDDLVRIEGKTPSQILAAALHMYIAFPDEAHRAFRVVETMGTESDRQATRREVTRSLLNGEYAVVRRNIASRLPVRSFKDDDDAMDEALRITKIVR